MVFLCVSRHNVGYPFDWKKMESVSLTGVIHEEIKTRYSRECYSWMDCNACEFTQFSGTAQRRG